MAREVEDRTAKMDLKNRANGSLARLSPLISGGVNNRNPDGALEIGHEGQKPNGSGLFLNKA